MIAHKRIALDFMGTMNSPTAKPEIWASLSDLVRTGDTASLTEAGMTAEQLRQSRDYIASNESPPMDFREYALAQEVMKATVGRWTSIAAARGQLDCCAVYDDAVDFLVDAKSRGYSLEIFSTIGAPTGFKNLSQIMLEQKRLTPAQAAALGAANAWELVDELVVSKKKKGMPGEAVLEETAAKGLYAYIDDERYNVGVTVHVFGKQEAVDLPILCRIEREGIKDPGYQAPNEHPNIGRIVTATTLMDSGLLNALYWG